MTSEYRQKLNSVVRKMKSGLHFNVLKQYFPHSSSRKAFFEILASLDIEFHITHHSKKIWDIKYTLDTSLNDALNRIENYDDAKLAKMYDYQSLLKKLKICEMNLDEICNFLGCTKRQYENILIYISLHYPIYQDGEMIGCL